MSRTETLQLTDSELLDSLRCFPQDVLPVRVLRELIQRGPTIQSEILRRLDQAVSHAGIGIGCIPLDRGVVCRFPCYRMALRRSRRDHPARSSNRSARCLGTK
jgi:hypothetical protein